MVNFQRDGHATMYCTNNRGDGSIIGHMLELTKDERGLLATSYGIKEALQGTLEHGFACATEHGWDEATPPSWTTRPKVLIADTNGLVGGADSSAIRNPPETLRDLCTV